MAMAPPIAAWAQKLTSSPDGMKNDIAGVGALTTTTLSQSHVAARFCWMDLDRGFGDAKIVTGFPPFVPRQKTRASIFSREIIEFSFALPAAAAVVAATDCLAAFVECMALRATTLDIHLALTLAMMLYPTIIILLILLMDYCFEMMILLHSIRSIDGIKNKNDVLVRDQREILLVT